MLKGLKDFWEDILDLQGASLRVGIVGMAAILLVLVLGLALYRFFVRFQN